MRNNLPNYVKDLFEKNSTKISPNISKKPKAEIITKITKYFADSSPNPTNSSTKEFAKKTRHCHWPKLTGKKLRECRCQINMTPVKVGVVWQIMMDVWRMEFWKYFEFCGFILRVIFYLLIGGRTKILNAWFWFWRGTLRPST